MKEIGIVTILGCGASAGVPLIGCKCETCTSCSKKNQRLRTSILIELFDKKVIVDTGPDFRYQMLREKIEKIDGIILTHMHFDHIAGIDDTRPFVFHNKPSIPIILSQVSYDDFQIKYEYLFKEHHSFTAKVDPIILSQFPKKLSFLDFDWQFISYYQARMQVLGFRLGNLLYLTDIKDYDDQMLVDLQNIDILIIGALKKEKTPFHLSIDEAIEIGRRLRAKKTYLTHLSHDVNYNIQEKELPKDVHLAYDGLKIEFIYERKTD